MVAIEVAPGNSSELLPADLQQQMPVMKLQPHTFATHSGKPVAVPSGEQDQAHDPNGLSYFEYTKGILLLSSLFSVLVLAVSVGGQF